MGTFLTFNQLLASVFGVIFNLLLLYLVKNATSLDIKAYSRLLALHSSADLLFVLIFTICSLRVVTTDTQLFVVVTGVLSNYGPTLGRTTILVYTMIFILEITLIPIDYFYRYMMVCKNRQFTTSRLMYCVCVSIGFAFIQTLISNFCIEFGPSPENLHYWKVINKTLQYDVTLPYAAYDPSNKYVSYNFISAVLIISISYNIIGYCTFKIRKTLRANERSRVRRESRRISVQITRIMILQALLPCIVFCAPAALVCSSFLLGIEFNSMHDFVCISIHWMPACKPLATIFIVHPYRRAFLRRINYRLAGETTVVSSNEESCSIKNTYSEPNEIYL
ncbi:unnamed protein product [Bursaphelenchus xylophilus]|uniref:(pine wood nematode) hypothetical protein n=1 Tax=Bursaphelenchus xylophilus TaxID=6326 RepID=A0A1I7SS95_BURXY|nr:unnamed protein product [Bursaphelenchus xylophilus]CAG9097870.1 unnamed protein product [Bursaphelenchus xylophilus]